MIARTALPAALLAAAVALAGCQQIVPPGSVRGSGNVRSESRDVHDFDRVEVGGVGTLTVAQGASEALTIRAEDNVLPMLQSTVRNGTLTLSPAPGAGLSPTRPIEYHLTVKQLREIDVSGAADASAAGLSADQFTLAISGSGGARLDQLTASALTVRLSGSGSARASGQAPQQTVSVIGSGGYDASGLASQRATADVSGSGSCSLRVSDELTATISGSGSVRYSGSPVVTQHVSGSGSVTKAG